MRIGLISDVHGNLPAFQAVLADAENQGAEELWCLGDLVGYGASPDACVELARERCSVCLAGNHDLVVTGEIPIEQFSVPAAEAALWTRDHIGDQSLAFLRGRAAQDPERTPSLYHGTPMDPVWDYLLSAWQAERTMELAPSRVAAVGHSHLALWFAREPDEELDGGPAGAGERHDLSRGEWVLNPGSVGQPRDGDPRAAWLLLDTEEQTAHWRRVVYPIDEAARAIEEAGLPPALGQRLYRGQ